MSCHMVELQVDERFRAQVSPESLRRAALTTLIHRGVEEPCELVVVVTDDEALQKLNRRYMGVNAPTDVLAFPDDARGPFVRASGSLRYLGDIIVSFPRAEAQAAEAGHSFQAELQLLVVHGALHLLGYDDVPEEGRTEMWSTQAEILRALDVKVNLPP